MCDKVKFHMTRRKSWNGNGFGYRPAAWEARFRNELVGTYDSSKPATPGAILGKTCLGLGYRWWRAEVAKQVAAREAARESKSKEQ